VTSSVYELEGTV